MLPQRVVSELTRAIDELNLVAIKLYPPYTPWKINRREWYPIYEFANERSLSILFHADHFRQSRLEF